MCYNIFVKQIELIKKYLSKLDIGSEATDVYIALFKLGPSSALQLTKLTGIKRTQVYRHLEELQKFGLASSEKLSYGTLFRALPLDNIEATIANKEAEIAALKRGISPMMQIMKSLAGSDATETTVKHYYGLAGLKQVNWNLTKATREFRVFEAAHLSQHLDIAFARRCRERFIEKGLVSYDLTNSPTLNIKELEPFNAKKAHVRYIDPKILSLEYEMYTYDNVVTLLDYSETNQQAIEIENPALAKMIRQLFDSIWTTATDIKVDA